MNDLYLYIQKSQKIRYNFLLIFPQLAVFCFLSWPYFVSSVGRILFPQLAVFCFLSWRNNVAVKDFIGG